MLLIARTLYDDLRAAALFDALGSQLRELMLVLAPDMDAQMQRCQERQGGVL